MDKTVLINFRGSYSTDLLWTIWDCYLGYPALIIGCEITFQHCLKLSDTALQHGLSAEESVPYDYSIPSPLFELSKASYFCFPLESDKVEPNDIIQHLLKVGYDMEQSNEEGRTPLLYLSTSLGIQALWLMRALLRWKANIHARDYLGDGVLHSILTEKSRREGIGYRFSSRQGYCMWNLVEFYCPCGDHINSYDYCSDGFDLRSILDESQRPTPSYKDGEENSDNEDDDDEDNDDEDDDDNNDDDNDNDDDDDDDDDDDEYKLMCPNSPGCDCVRNPEPRSLLERALRTRVKLKLFHMLRAGCDPNLLNDLNQSPSDYAMESHLYSEWTWALRHTGYEYDDASGKWIQNEDAASWRKVSAKGAT